MTGPGNRGRPKSEVHFAGAGSPDHLNQLFARVPPDQAVIHHHYGLPVDYLADRIELDLDLGYPERLRWVNKRAAHVVIPDKPVLQLDPGDLREAEGHGVGA